MTCDFRELARLVFSSFSLFSIARKIVPTLEETVAALLFFLFLSLERSGHPS